MTEITKPKPRLSTTPESWEPQLVEPRGACSSCIDTLDDLDWVTSSTFRVGPWALGVRSSSFEMDETLQHVLADHLVDVEAPANFSALMADGATRTFNFVYRASDFLVRTRTPGRVVRTLIAHLSEFAENGASSAAPTIRLHATGLIIDGRAIVAPDALRAEMANIETRLNVAGISVIDAPTIHLDPVSGQLIVPEPALTVDTDALAQYELTHPARGGGRELAPVLPGSYPIAAWALVTGEDRIGPLGPAQGVAAAAQQVVNADAFGAERTLEIIAAALAPTAISGIWWQDSGELVAQLAALASGAQ